MRTSLVSLILAVSLSVLGAACGSQKTEETSSSPAASPASAPPAESGYEGSGVTGAGSISGVAKLIGSRPRLAPRPVTKSQEICGSGTKPSEEIITGSDGGLKNVVVTLEGIRKGKQPVPANPILDQIHCDYVPHIQSVTAGSTLEIRNSDDLLHNVHGKLEGRATIFNLAMPLKGQRISKTLAKPGLITLQCDAGHTWMTGYIVVVEHPYHATSDASGRFVLADVPPASYKVKAWHEKLGSLEQDLNVSTGSETKVTFEFKLP